MTVKNPSIKLNQTEATLAVNETVKLTATTAPKSAASSVTYTTSDEKVATVANDGTVKAVAAGEATITASAKCGSKTVTATAKVTVKKYGFKSVKQTRLAELEAEITGDTKSIKASDITIKAPDNVVLPVKSISVDSKDATKVTLATFTDMKDSKEYSVTLDGVTQTFVATDAKVSTIGLDKITIPVKTETEIKLVAKDANGVVLKELAFGSSDVNYDFTITTANGYTKGSKLYLNKVGDTAIAEITYKTNKYTADGKPDGNIGPNKVTITATEQSAVSSFKVRIGEANKKYSSLKDNDKIAVGETKAVYAYFEIKDTDGKEISGYGDYSLESSDTTILMLGDTKMGNNHQVRLTPAKEGQAYIFIKKDDKIVSSVPVTVVAARKVTTMTADKTSFSLAKTGITKETVSLAVKDQYGNDFDFTSGDGAVEPSCSGAPDGVNKTAVTLPNGPTQSGNKVKFVFDGSDYATKGTYTFKFAFKKDGKEVCAQIVTVNVQEPGEDGSSLSYSLNILNSDGAVQTEEDAVVNADNMSNRALTVNVSELLNGVEKKQLTDGATLDEKTEAGKDNSKVRGIYYKVTNAKGDVIFNNDPTLAKPVTNSAINVGASANVSDGLTVDVVKKNGDDFTKLAAGTYTITATIEIEPKHATAGYSYDATKNTKTTVSKSFVIKDSSNDAITEMKLKDSKVDPAGIKDALASVIQFSYEGDKYGADGDYSAVITAIEGYSSVITENGGKITSDNMNTMLTSGKTANITKVTVKVAFKDANGVIKGYVTQEVSVSLSITAK